MRAGSTFHREGSGDGISGNSWRSCSASSFDLRIGPNYDRNKQKRPSPEALMELVGMELVF